MGNGLAFRVDYLGILVASRTALGVEHHGAEFSRIVSAPVERAHAFRIALALVIATVLGKGVEIRDGASEDFRIGTDQRGKCFGGVCRFDCGLTLFGDVAVILEQLVLRTVEHEMGRIVGDRRPPNTARVHVSVAMAGMLVNEPASVIANQHDAAIAVVLAVEGNEGRAGIGDARLEQPPLPLFDSPRVAAQYTQRFVCLHVPEVGTDFDAHAHAIAPVMQGTERR